jgi:hypothetical protein
MRTPDLTLDKEMRLQALQHAIGQFSLGMKMIRAKFASPVPTWRKRLVRVRLSGQWFEDHQIGLVLRN